MVKWQAKLLSWSLPSKEKRKGETSAARNSDIEQESNSDFELEERKGTILEREMIDT